MTPERWESARSVLLGNDSRRVSRRAAAEAAGVTLSCLERWLARSRERRPEDEAWVWDIAEVVDVSHLSQASVLEDRLWSYALEGVPKDVYHAGEKVGRTRVHNPALAMRMLEKRDDEYVRKNKVQLDVDVRVMPAEEVFQRMVAQRRYAEVENQSAASRALSFGEEAEYRGIVDRALDADCEDVQIDAIDDVVDALS